MTQLCSPPSYIYTERNKHHLCPSSRKKQDCRTLIERSPSVVLEKKVDDTTIKFGFRGNFCLGGIPNDFSASCQRPQYVGKNVYRRFPGEGLAENGTHDCSECRKEALARDCGIKRTGKLIPCGNWDTNREVNLLNLIENHNHNSENGREIDSDDSTSSLSELNWEDDDELVNQLQCMVLSNSPIWAPNIWRVKRKLLKAEKKQTKTKKCDFINQKPTHFKIMMNEHLLQQYLNHQHVINKFRKRKFAESHKAARILCHWQAVIDAKLTSNIKFEDNSACLCEAEKLLHELTLWKSNLAKSIEKLMCYVEYRMKPIENLLCITYDAIYNGEKKHEGFLKFILEKAVCHGWVGHRTDIEGLKQIQVNLMRGIKNTQEMFIQAEKSLKKIEGLQERISEISIQSMNRKMQESLKLRVRKEPFYKRYNPFYQFFK